MRPRPMRVLARAHPRRGRRAGHRVEDRAARAASFARRGELSRYPQHGRRTRWRRRTAGEQHDCAHGGVSPSESSAVASACAAGAMVEFVDVKVRRMMFGLRRRADARVDRKTAAFLHALHEECSVLAADGSFRFERCLRFGTPVVARATASPSKTLDSAVVVRPAKMMSTSTPSISAAPLITALARSIM